MGEVIQLDERRRERRVSGRARTRGVLLRTEFLFDLACPFTYLAAQRVGRAFESVVWTPVSRAAVTRDSRPDDPVALRRLCRAVEARAGQLREPLVWAQAFPGGVPAAMRVATYAPDCGRGAAFTLAAGRLAYC